MTHYRSQASRTVRVPGWWIGLALMIASAFLLLVALAMVVPWFLSFAQDVQQVLP